VVEDTTGWDARDLNECVHIEVVARALPPELADALGSSHLLRLATLQKPSTREAIARRIVAGADHVRIFREDIPVRAKIYKIGGFSAHADRDELLRWHGATGKPTQTFLVHGDEEAMQSFAHQLHDTKVTMPQVNDEFEL
jgi:Cft2 family RNA processing exonuclease